VAGKIVNIIEKTNYNFDQVGTPTQLATAFLPVGYRIRTLEYTQATLVLRIHDGSIDSGSLQFGLYPDGYLDATTYFLGITPLHFQTITSSTAIPSALIGGTSAWYSEYLSVGLLATTPAAPNLRATVSVDVCLRNADETVIAEPPPVLFATLPERLRTRNPRLNELAKVFKSLGLDVNSVEFSVKDLPEGFAAQAQSGREIALSPKLLASRSPDDVMAVIAHELTHIRQIRSLGFEKAAARAASEQRSHGKSGMRVVPSELRDMRIRDIDPVDKRFTLEQLGSRVADAVRESTGAQASSSRRPRSD